MSLIPIRCIGNVHDEIDDDFQKTNDNEATTTTTTTTKKQKTLGISKPNVANAKEKAHFEEKNLMTSIGEKCKLSCQISSIK